MEQKLDITKLDYEDLVDGFSTGRYTKDSFTEESWALWDKAFKAVAETLAPITAKNLTIKNISDKVKKSMELNKDTQEALAKASKALNQEQIQQVLNTTYEQAENEAWIAVGKPFSKYTKEELIAKPDKEIKEILATFTTPENEIWIAVDTLNDFDKIKFINELDKRYLLDLPNKSKIKPKRKNTHITDDPFSNAILKANPKDQCFNNKSYQKIPIPNKKDKAEHNLYYKGKKLSETDILIQELIGEIILENVNGLSQRKDKEIIKNAKSLSKPIHIPITDIAKKIWGNKQITKYDRTNIIKSINKSNECWAYTEIPKYLRASLDTTYYKHKTHILNAEITYKPSDNGNLESYVKVYEIPLLYGLSKQTRTSDTNIKLLSETTTENKYVPFKELGIRRYLINFFKFNKKDKTYKLNLNPILIHINKNPESLNRTQKARIRKQIEGHLDYFVDKGWIKSYSAPKANMQRTKFSYWLIEPIKKEESASA